MNIKQWFRQKKNLEMIVFVAILVLFGLLVTYKITLPSAEDLPRQMMNGKNILEGDFSVLRENVYSYTDPNHEFANHHWLYGVFAYLVYKIGGFEAIVLIKIIIFVGMLWLLFKTAQRRASFWLVALFSIPTIVMLMGRSAARPEMFSYLFTVIFLYLLTRFEQNPKDKKIFWILPLQLFWANIHILFPAGVAIVGAFWLSLVIKQRKNLLHEQSVKTLTIVLAGVSLVSFLNPFGIQGVIYSLTANTIAATKIFSAEVQSIASVFRTEPKMDYLGAVFFFPALAVLVLSFVAGYKRKNIAYAILSIAFAFLSLRIIRGIPLFALVFLPAVTSNLEPWYQKAVSWIASRGHIFAQHIFWFLKGIFILFVFYCIFFLRERVSPYQVFGIGLTETSNEPIEFFKKNNLSGPILNDTDIGSYLIWHLYPQEKVFADNRFADAYSREFLEGDYSAAFGDSEKWNAVLKKYEFKVIMINHYNRGSDTVGFIYDRIYDPEWVWVYAGRDALIFVRNIPEHKDVIARYAITPDTIVHRLQHLASAPDYHGQVAAADLLSYAGYAKFSIVQYQVIVSKKPHLGKIWYIIGRNELLRADQANSDSAQALLALKRAVKEGYKTPYAYSYLALAYYRLGDLDSAEKAVKKELKIDPESKDGQAWKGVLLKERLRQLDADTF